MSTTTTEAQQEQRRDEPEQELALADLDLPDVGAREVTGGRVDSTSGAPGGCDDFGCGTNHNEVLAVTA